MRAVCLLASVAAASSFNALSSVPGRAASLHFSASIRAAGTNASWQTLAVLETMAKDASGPGGCGYFAHLNNWTASWASFELGADGKEVEVLVQRASSPITKAVVKPESASARVVSIDSTGVRIAVYASARFHLEVDGGMDETNTGPDYTGPPMHTMAIFAEPNDPSAPSKGQPGVVWIEPGDTIPSASALPANTSVLAFGPGVHRVAPNSDGYQVYTLPDKVRLHLSLGAFLHAGLTSDPGATFGTQMLHVSGHGVISGEENLREAHSDSRHLSRSTPHAGCADNNAPRGLSIQGAATAILDGVTMVDHPNLHIIATAVGDCVDGAPPGVASNLKVLGWRANGDGFHVMGLWKVSDLFLRTQDDNMYTHMSTKAPKPGCPEPVFERLTNWNDANGANYLITGYGSTLRDSDILYMRTSYAWWSGGRAFGNRRMMSAINQVVSNVRVHDPLPSMNTFQIDESDGPPGPVEERDGGDNTGRSFHNVTFINITVANLSTIRTCPADGAAGCNCRPACSAGPLPAGMPNVLLGGADKSQANNISGLRFVNVTVAGMAVHDLPSHAAGWLNVSGMVFDVTLDGTPL